MRVKTAEDATLRVAIDHLLEGVQIIGRDWRYRYVNDMAARHGNTTPADLLGRTMMSAYPGIESTDLFVMLDRVMRTRRSEHLLNEFTLGGASRWFELRVEPVPDGICVLSIEVTQQRTAELQLRQAQKMEAIGQLASGMAHDLNNVLTVILGYADLIAEQIGPDKPIGGDLQEIVFAAERASALTHRLLAFSRKHRAAPVPLALNAVVDAVVPMLRRLLPESIDMEVSLGAEVLPVEADAIELEQVVINLAVNARDAMSSGGRLTIVTRPARLSAAEAEGREVPPGDYVVLSVRDTGVGISAGAQKVMFDPFFTTKAPGHGTGLGLAAVRGVVSRSGGYIEVESEPGAGAEFTIYLPRTALPIEVPAPKERVGAPVGYEKVLLVEDEPGVQSFARTVLQRHGYRVLCADTGHDAVAMGTRSRDRIHLLLTDVVLPDMNGRELAERITAAQPAVRVLFTSGYAEPFDGGAPPVVALLEKPFTAQALLARVRGALDA